MKSQYTKLALTAAIVSFPTAISGAILFTEDFSSNTAGPNLVPTSSVGGATPPSFAGGNAAFTGTGNTGRNYYGTIDTDYNTTNFTASIDIQNNANNGTFFGFGAGITDGNGTGGSFGEPSNGPAIYLVSGSSDFIGDFASSATSGIAQNANANNGAPASNLINNDNSVTTITLTYDATANTATFTSSLAGSTPVVVDTSDNGFDATNSRIFFGGSDGTFDNLVVTPEPSSALLCGLGALSLLVRRRK